MRGESVPGPNGQEASGKGSAEVPPALTRLDDAIYQNGQLVARAVEAELDLGGREVRFGELFESDRLVLPDECEYQKCIILIQKVAYASRSDRSAPHKGRVLRGVVAEILRHREK